MVNYKRTTGILLIIAVTQFLFLMNISEYLYPNYSVSNNFISDLGATCRNGSCVIYQPSSIIFNSSVILLGILLIAASYFFIKAFRKVLIMTFFLITGIGAVGVGVFPETAGILHSIFSLITFLFAGLSVIATAIIVKEILRYFGILMGVISFLALFLFISDIYLGLGPGGMERLIVYPTLVWGISFGSYLIKE